MNERWRRGIAVICTTDLFQKKLLIHTPPPLIINENNNYNDVLIRVMYVFPGF